MRALVLALALCPVLAWTPAPRVCEVRESRWRTVTASWYGPGFHGRFTASGEAFDAGAMTCAHKSLPFGTVLTVRRGSRVVRVRVTDRGPFVRGRELDLSEAAAEALGMTGAGVARVEVEQ